MEPRWQPAGRRTSGRRARDLEAGRGPGSAGGIRHRCPFGVRRTDAGKLARLPEPRRPGVNAPWVPSSGGLLAARVVSGLSEALAQRIHKIDDYRLFLFPPRLLHHFLEFAPCFNELAEICGVLILVSCQIQ